MKISTDCPQTIKGLETILGSILEASQHKVLYGIQKNRFDSHQIESMNLYVQGLTLTLKKEYNDFQRDADGFIETFVHENNKIIDGHKLVFKNMEHSLIGVRNIMNKFSTFKNIRSERYRNVETPSLYRNCYVSHSAPYSIDLFGVDSFENEDVKNLCNSVVIHFNLLETVLNECLDLLKNEEIVKNDKYQTEPYYNEYAQMVINVFTQGSKVVEYDPANLSTLLNPLKEMRKRFDDDLTFIQYLYHNESPVNVQRYILIDKFCNQKPKDITSEECALFGEDVEKVEKVRLIIAQFNRLAHHPKNGELKKIDTMSIACFALWCSPLRHKKRITTFFTYFARQYNLSADHVELPSFERVYKKVQGVGREDQKAFHEKLEMFLFEVEQNKNNIRNTSVS